MPQVTVGREGDATNLDVNEAEGDAADETLGLETPLGGEKADTGFGSVHDRLVVELALSGREVAGGEAADFVAIAYGTSGVERCRRPAFALRATADAALALQRKTAA
jgi:hypothetical protein